MRMPRAASSRRKEPSLCPIASFIVVGALLSTLSIMHSLAPSSSSARHRSLLNGGWAYRATSEPQLGRYGELMLSFLPPYLPFTLFIPTPSVFETMLLSISRGSNTSDVASRNVSISEEENTYAVVSRIFGFSAIPCRILSRNLALNSEMAFDSVSGFRLNLMRLAPKGILMVNNLVCSTVDIVKGSVVVHLVDGILMDTDFEQSVMPFQDDVDEDLGIP